MKESTLEPRPATMPTPKEAKLEAQPRSANSAIGSTSSNAPQVTASPPPPRVPKSPRRTVERAAQAAQAAIPEPPSKTRELSADPAAREAALAEGRPLATMLIAILNVAATRLPPQRPLSAEERAAIQDPMEQVIWKYSVAMSCEWSLTLAIGSVAFMRYIEVHPEMLTKLGINISPDVAQDVAQAAQQTVEVK